MAPPKRGKRTGTILAAVLLLIALGFVFVASDRTPADDEPLPSAVDHSAVDHSAVDNVSVTPPLIKETAYPPASAEETRVKARYDGPCLTLEQLQHHPMFAPEQARMEAISINGPTIASYRGLASDELEVLVAQGDSAAMAVLGAMALMNARGQSPDDAVPYLLLEDADLRNYQMPDRNDPDVVEQLEAARSWFYQAALHGRLRALQEVGDIRWQLEGGAVELGWVEAETYNALGARERSTFLPINVYNLTAYEIAPQLRDGPAGLLYQLMPRDPSLAPVISGLAEQFEQDRIDAGLPPIRVPQTTLPSPKEWIKPLCAEYRENLPPELLHEIETQ